MGNKPKRKALEENLILPEEELDDIYIAIEKIVNDRRAQAFVALNRELTLLNWQIGRLLNESMLNHQRAEYGKHIVENLSKRLTLRFGNGWSKQQLWNCIRIAEIFPKEEIISTLSGELSWSHLREVSYLKTKEEIEFYVQMSRFERWSVRQLRQQIEGMLYQRTVISKKPEKLIQQELQQATQQGRPTESMIFKDPYLLDFLGLSTEVFSENDLETAIIVELQKFLIELGSDFAFLGRQKRITIDNEDYYIDLLFYHRSLQCLVAIDLKLGKFKAAYKGQMELYLRWLEKYEKKPGEKDPIGLILCADKSEEHIELLMMNEQRIKVAAYITELPPKEVLQDRLHRAIHAARERAELKRKIDSD